MYGSSWVQNKDKQNSGWYKNILKNSEVSTTGFHVLLLTYNTPQLTPLIKIVQNIYIQQKMDIVDISENMASWILQSNNFNEHEKKRDQLELTILIFITHCLKTISRDGTTEDVGL